MAARLPLFIVVCVASCSAYHHHQMVPRASQITAATSSILPSAAVLAGVTRSKVVRSQVVLSANLDGEAEDLARQAGAAAVAVDVQEQRDASKKSDAARAREAKGTSMVVTIKEKPLGVVLATNPTGRGVFVAEIEADSAAARTGKLEVGDYVTEVCVKGPSRAGFNTVWKGLDDVLAVLEETPAPVTLRLRRGGPEPWSLERDGSGLSVEEMVQTTKQQYGRLLDESQEDALRAAFAQIKEGERRKAAEEAARGGYESDSLQTLSRLQFELRSFAQGARDALESLQQFVYNRALLDSKLAVQTAEYLLRRAIFDSGRILSAASSAVAALGPGGSSSASGVGAAAPLSACLAASRRRAPSRPPPHLRSGVRRWEIARRRRGSNAKRTRRRRRRARH